MTSSDSTVKFGGKFQVQLLSMTCDCTFRFERGKGATFKADGSGPFTTNDLHTAPFIYVLYSGFYLQGPKF